LEIEKSVLCFHRYVINVEYLKENLNGISIIIIYLRMTKIAIPLCLIS
jgi:hypothetical protein